MQSVECAGCIFYIFWFKFVNNWYYICPVELWTTYFYFISILFILSISWIFYRDINPHLSTYFSSFHEFWAAASDWSGPSTWPILASWLAGMWWQWDKLGHRLTNSLEGCLLYPEKYKPISPRLANFYCSTLFCGIEYNGLRQADYLHNRCIDMGGCYGTEGGNYKQNTDSHF